MKFSLSSVIYLSLLFYTVVTGQTTFIERQQITAEFFWRTPYNICTADLDGDHDQDILVADYGGEPQSGNQIVWYKNLDGAGNFSNATSIPSNGFVMMTVIHAADLDGDGDMDFIAADDSELLAWFKNLDGRGNFGAQKNLTTLSWHSDCIRTADVDLDGDMDIISVSFNDRYVVFWFENLDGNGTFSDIKSIYSDTAKGAGADDLAIEDMDGDGDPDIMALIYETDNAKIFYFENLGGDNFGNPQNIGSYTSGSSIAIADIDNDNDNDVIAASTAGLLFYENLNGQADFASARILVSTYTGVVLPEDLDNDNDIDLLWADQVSRLICYYNDGSGGFNSQRIVSNQIDNPGVICTPDFDNDGDRDILIGAGRLFFTGSIIWFENTLITTTIDLDQSELTEIFRLYQNYPNPFNPSTNIRFELTRSGNVQLKIYNIHGQEIRTLVDDVFSAGEHVVQWQADGLPSGIYFYKIVTEQSIQTQKLILLP